MEHEELHAKGVVSEEDNSEPFDQEVLDPVPSPSPTPVITSAPPSTPVPAVADTVHSSSSGPVPDLVHTPTPDTAPSASSASHPTPISVSTLDTVQSSDATPAPEPVSTPEQVIQTMESHSSGQEPQLQVQQHSMQDQSQETVNHSHSPVDTVSLTDVTAMLLEGTMDGGRPMNSQATNLCKYVNKTKSSHKLLWLLKKKHHLIIVYFNLLGIAKNILATMIF